MGLGGFSYYSTDFPFLNLLAQGYNNGMASQRFPMITQTSSGTDTGEEQYLQQDVNGWPTTLVAGNGFSGNQQFTQASLQYPLTNIQTGVGLSYAYTPGTYRLYIQGSGQINFAASNLTAISAGLNVSGTVITSNLTSSNIGYITCSLNGLSCPQIQIKQTDPNSTGDYIKKLALVLDKYGPNYEVGEIWNPDWLALVNQGFTAFRFMDWLNTNNSQQSGILNVAPNSNAVSANLSSSWAHPTGQYYVAFDTGDERIANFTYGNTSFSWSTGLSKAGSGTTFWYSTKAPSWNARSQISDSCYGTSYGVPWELIVDLCNKLNVSPWINIPPEMMDVDVTSLVNYLYSNLNSNLIVYVEFGNEVWNNAFKASAYCTFRGNSLWAGATNPYQSYMGMRIAQISDIFVSVFGSTSPRFKIIAGSQAANPYHVEQILTAPDWVAHGGTVPWSAHRIDGICIDQYWDWPTPPLYRWLSEGQDAYTTNLLRMMQYGDVVAGSYTQFGFNFPNFFTPTGRLLNHINAMKSYGNLPVYAYEGDPGGTAQQFFFSTEQNLPKDWVANHQYSIGTANTIANNIYICVGSGYSGSVSPAPSINIGETFTDNTATWMRINYRATTWGANTNYQIGDIVYDSNQADQLCISPGISGQTTPTWANTHGTTTSDGTVTWIFYTSQDFGGTDSNHDAAHLPYFANYNRNKRLARLQKKWIDNFYKHGGQMLMYFVDLSSSTKFGCWGALESLLQTTTTGYDTANNAPKWAALLNSLNGSQ